MCKVQYMYRVPRILKQKPLSIAGFAAVFMLYTSSIVLQQLDGAKAPFNTDGETVLWMSRLGTGRRAGAAIFLVGSPERATH